MKIQPKEQDFHLACPPRRVSNLLLLLNAERPVQKEEVENS
jgi:hypothetical protein